MVDQVDKEIIRQLQHNSRMQLKEIGEAVHMTGAAVTNRIRRMEETGVIERYTVKVNEKKLGNIYCVYVTVAMKDYKHTRFLSFIQERDEIKEAHRVSGEPCFILKVEVPDHERLNQLLDDILAYGYYKINISIGQIK